jgi:hypothetical protein
MQRCVDLAHEDFVLLALLFELVDQLDLVLLGKAGDSILLVVGDRVAHHGLHCSRLVVGLLHSMLRDADLLA